MSKEPRAVLESIWAFPPNRETFGGTAYLIVENAATVPQSTTPKSVLNPVPNIATTIDQEIAQLAPRTIAQANPQNILIDCPSWDDNTQTFLQQQGGVQHLVITHRQGASLAAASIQHCFNCQVWVQEQEAYLLPDGVITSFQQAVQITDQIQVFWTPGYSPGSACIYYTQQGGVLFTGRHLLPDQQGNPLPLRTAKTFHWPRQIKSVREMVERFDAQSLHYLCPGANTGFLRQQRYIDQAYQKLAQLDFTALAQHPVGL